LDYYDSEARDRFDGGGDHGNDNGDGDDSASASSGQPERSMSPVILWRSSARVKLADDIPSELRSVFLATGTGGLNSGMGSPRAASMTPRPMTGSIGGPLSSPTHAIAARAAAGMSPRPGVGLTPQTPGSSTSANGGRAFFGGSTPLMTSSSRAAGGAMRTSASLHLSGARTLAIDPPTKKYKHPFKVPSKAAIHEAQLKEKELAKENARKRQQVRSVTDHQRLIL
jgi:hypothetical protein